MAALTLAEADQIIAGACAKMEEIGVKLTISVVDGRGDLIALARVDGASWRTPYISQGKAVASATWGLSSADMAARWSEPIFPGFMALQGGRFIPSQGALPIYKDGELVGAAGGSGGHSPGGRRLRSRRHRIRRLRNRRITSIMRIRGNHLSVAPASSYHILFYPAQLPSTPTDNLECMRRQRPHVLRRRHRASIP